MTLTNSELSSISQALAMAASRYVEIAADTEQLPGGTRLAEQFRTQAIQTRKIAILFGDADSVTIVGVEDEAAAHEDSRRITAQEVIDLGRSRAKAGSSGS